MKAIITIPALGDNYIYLCRCAEKSVFVIDPSNASVVFDFINKHNLTLKAALLTHYHLDHIGGVLELAAKTGCEVIGPDKNKIACISRSIKDKDVIKIEDTTVEVMATPGHTPESVCYYLPPSENNKRASIFTGDTLFVGGCGRIADKDAETMWNSLQKIAALDDKTFVYPGHDYAMENYKFALTIEPNNAAIKQRIEHIKELQSNRRLVAPSTIIQEKQTNVFLRVDTVEIKTALDMADVDDVEVFAYLRRCKNFF